MAFSNHPIENFCCQNQKCLAFGLANLGNLSFCGWSGKVGIIHMIRCNICKTRFSERKGTVFWESRLPQEKSLSILDHLREGCGTRATSRLVHVSKDTVTRYACRSGSHAQKMHDQLVSFSPSNERNPTRRKMELCGEEGKND